MSGLLDKAGPSGEASVSSRDMRKMLRYYDTNGDNRLNYKEARRYLGDLLELSGMQANLIREARESGEGNIAQWYETYLNELFQHMDTDHDGFVDINELVRPGANEVSALLGAVSAKMSEPAQAPGNTLVLSSMMRQTTESMTQVFDDPTSAPCINGCGFYGTAMNYGYCEGCAELVAQSAAVVAPVYLPPTVDSVGDNPYGVIATAPPLEISADQPVASPRDVVEDLKALEELTPAPAISVEKQKRRRRKKKRPPTTKASTPAKDKGELSASDEHDDHVEEAENGFDNDSDFTSESEANELLDDFLEISSHARHAKFSVLDGDQVEKLMARKTRDASELLGLTQDEAALVLMYFNWNASRLQEQYFLDVDKYRRLSGVDLDGGGSKVQQAEEAGDCVICFDSVKPSETATLNCGHGPFCHGCYQDYLTEKVRDHGATAILSTSCMGQDCSLRLSPMQWRRLASTTDYSRYQYFYLKQFIESTNNLGFCPNPSCTKVVKFSGLGRPADVVECMCGHKYCFMCLKEAHNPVACEQFDEWNAKNNGDSESIKFILASSKQCPHCGMATARNEGCNHMTCRADVGGCGGGWCWMCRGDWKTHGSATGGYFSCNLYDKSKAKEVDEASGDVVKEAMYFQHFVDRFLNHGQLENDAAKKREVCITQWMVDYREETGGLDPTFLLEALELLIRCRHTLKMTYVYAWFQDEAILKNTGSSSSAPIVQRSESYNSQLHDRLKFLKKKVQKRQASVSTNLEMLKTEQELFNFQQASLEGVTEDLGELIFAKTKIASRADEIKNLTSVTSRYLQNLINGFHEMMEDDDSWD